MIFCESFTFDKADKFVQELTRVNIATFARHIGVEPSVFPKPQARNVVEEISCAVEGCERVAPRSTDLDSYSRLFLMFIFAGLKFSHGKIKTNDSTTFQQASDTCFFLAYNYIQLCKKNDIDKAYLKLFTDLDFNVNRLSSVDIDTISAKWWRCGLFLTELEVSGEYPTDLIRELKNCRCVEAMLDKIIYYQMLSPKAVRKEDTKEALLIGFKHSHK